MRTLLAPRTSAILYDLLCARADKRPFLLPANICPIVPITFMKAGADFAFVDIDPATLHMDLNATFDQLRTNHFGGVLYAHTYGEPTTPNDFFAEAKRLDHAALIVDDRCLCAPDLIPNDPTADVTLYSTGYAKVVDIGTGGYAFINDDVDYQRHSLPFDSQALAAQEQAYKQSMATSSRFTYHDSAWLETRTELTWEAYRVQVESVLAESLAHRQAINAIYMARLPGEIQFPDIYQSWRFNIKVDAKKKILDAIFAAGLFASSHYASLAGIMADGHCPQAERLSASVINLFNDHHFTVEMAERVCGVIMNIL